MKDFVLYEVGLRYQIQIGQNKKLH